MSACLDCGRPVQDVLLAAMCAPCRRTAQHIYGPNGAQQRADQLATTSTGAHDV